jgi:hypothetical protein
MLVNWVEAVQDIISRVFRKNNHRMMTILDGASCYASVSSFLWGA